MKKLLLALLTGMLTTPLQLAAWGVWGHDHINRAAVLALPQEMGLFFYNHIDYITQESTVPDLRKYTLNDKAENPRHYIDLEKYDYTTPAAMPQTLSEAQAKFTKDSLDKYGILPWYIEDMVGKLTEAFKKKRKAEILFLAADLGHYVADAHMPLHTTFNHNGQLTGQQGIHAFWESQLPELFGKTYKLCTGEAHYVKNVRQTIWEVVDSSFALVYPLLVTEGKMRKDNPEEKRYEKGPDGQFKKNKFNQPVHTYEYAHVYHELLGGMVERQMRKAIIVTSGLWYTAWVNAGKPDLSGLDPEFITERNKPLYKQDMKAWKTGKVKGCGSDKEF
ncbi:MAG: zinc dependent phospholipase C family protein [Bacteroidota bacterium]